MAKSKTKPAKAAKTAKASSGTKSEKVKESNTSIFNAPVRD